MVLCIVGIEIGKRLAFYGISANLVTYLTHVLHEGTEVLATNVNNWIGATFIALLLGAFLGNAFWGRLRPILIFGAVYFVVSVQSSSPFSQLVRSMITGLNCPITFKVDSRRSITVATSSPSYFFPSSVSRLKSHGVLTQAMPLLLLLQE